MLKKIDVILKLIDLNKLDLELFFKINYRFFFIIFVILYIYFFYNFINKLSENLLIFL